MFTNPELCCHCDWVPSFQSLKKCRSTFLFQQLWKEKYTWTTLISIYISLLKKLIDKGIKNLG